MPTPQPVNIPKPPDSANIEEMHAWMLSFYSFYVTNHATGSQAPFFSQSQLNQMVSENNLEQAGKVFMNNDTGELNVGTIVAGNLVMKVV